MRLPVLGDWASVACSVCLDNIVCILRRYNCGRPMALTSGTKLGPYEILAPWARVGWGRCIAPATRGWIARLRSRFFLPHLPVTPIALIASYTKRAS